MNTEKNVARVVAGLLICGMVLINPNAVESHARKKITGREIKVGQRLRLKHESSGTSFKSSNSAVASVDGQGVVTGKKEGEAQISVTRTGKRIKRYTVKVKKEPHKPAGLPVTFSELSLSEKENGRSGENGYQVDIANSSKKGTVKRIRYFYHVTVQASTSRPLPQKPAEVESGQAVSPRTVQVETEGAQVHKEKREICLTAKNIRAGKKVRAVCTKPQSGVTYPAFDQAKLVKIEMYTGNALYTYDAGTGRYRFRWGTKDTKAPVITGLIKEKSAPGYHDIFRIYYADKRKQYNFTQFVKAEDDRDKTVKVKADTSKINWKKEGVYKLWFSAKDRAGNKARTWAYVRVYIPGTAESAADTVLRSITRESWSQEAKARAIYRYIRGHCSYISHTTPGNWRLSALRGLRYHSGDCYTYYSMSRLLLTRAGIPNVLVKRYPVPSGRPHYWNLAYVSGGWYHFDTTPRSRNANFCLWTDAQLWEYSTGYVFQFKRNLFPKRAVKRL